MVAVPGCQQEVGGLGAAAEMVGVQGEAAAEGAQGSGQSRRAQREEENDFAVGGMAVEKVRRSGDFPQVLRAAKHHGGASCKLDADLVEAWKGELRDLLHGRTEELVLKEKIDQEPS